MFYFFNYFYIIRLAVLGGELAVPCNSQPAIVRLINRYEVYSSEVSAYISGVESLVLCGGGLQTPSDPRGSSGK